MLIEINLISMSAMCTRHLQDRANLRMLVGVAKYQGASALSAFSRA